MTALSFPSKIATVLEKAETLVLLAPAPALSSGWLAKVLPKALAKRAEAVARDLKPGPLGHIAESIGEDGPRRLVVGALPAAGSRHNSPTRHEAILSCARKAAVRGKAAFIVAVDAPGHAQAAAVSIARSCPLFDRKTGKDKGSAKSVAVVVVDRAGRRLPVDAGAAQVVEAVQWAARLVDTPTCELDTASFVSEARALLKGQRKVRIEVVAGEALKRMKLNGIYNVGKAAETAPRLLILEHKPAKAKLKVALVGKGVVYDTGGLSLKPTTSMSTMKGDMGGAAAVVAAFNVLAATKAPMHVVAFAALAENAIGPGSYRNDDILTLHSGHTVEINNTDAEGRLLLADAVSLAARQHEPDLVIDIATLTGAQLVATGIRHAAVVSNRQGLEDLARTAGMETGDLVFPLPFAPEFYQGEFRSVVADMKNSVSNRSNAQSSCAAQFVYSHIDDLDVPWMHFDIAGPSLRDERGTGFGVALLVECARRVTKQALAE